MRTTSLSRVLLAVTLTGCQVKLSTPVDASIQCTAAADCPAGSGCVVSLGKCFADTAACVVAGPDGLQTATNGNHCPLAGGGDGICVNGACSVSRCGDGVTNTAAGEQCDSGSANSDFAPDACRLDCKLPACGDGVVDEGLGEVCDDGNTTSGDGCRGDCRKVEVCGDGVVDAGEACDDHNTQSGDGCRGDCKKVEVCGDGTVDAGEACDDGNTTSGDGCRGDCKKIEICGDGIIDAGEACDDRNTDPNDGCDACRKTTWVADVLVGGGAEAVSLSSFSFYYPYAVTIDRQGVVYLSDSSHRIFRVDTLTGDVTLYAGNGQFGFSGDGGLATDAQLWSPRGLALDARGNLFVADTSNHRIRRIDSETGIITTVAGTGVACPNPVPADGCGDGGAATAARLNRPDGVSVDRAGNLVVADTQSHRVRLIDARTGVITTVAGTGTGCTTLDVCGDGGPATAAQLYYPGRALVGPDNRLYIADTYLNRVRVVDASSGTPIISTLAGVPLQWCSGGKPCGDGGPATDAPLRTPVGLAFDASGNLYVSNMDDYRVRKIDLGAAPPTISTFAGSSVQCVSSADACGDGSPAINARLALGTDLAMAADGRLLIVDQNAARLRVVGLDGIISRLAGTGRQGYRGDGGAGLAATFAMVRSVTVGPQGDVFLADFQGAAVRRLDATTGIVTTYAGVGVPCPTGTDCGMGVPATQTYVHPFPLVTDDTGNLYIGELQERRVLRVSAATGVIEVLAGTTADCTNPVATDGCGDGGPATAARLGVVVALAYRDGVLYIGHAGSPRVRAVDLGTGLISTVAGSGVACADPTVAQPCGDGGPALSGQLNFPVGLGLDAAGDLYVSDGGNYHLWKITLSSTSPAIANLGGTGLSCPSLDSCPDGPATTVAMNGRGLAVGPTGVVYYVEYSGAVRKLEGGMITTVAGSSAATGPGDGGPLLAAVLGDPEGLSFDHSGRLLITEAFGYYGVRVLDLTADRIDSLTSVDPLGDGPFEAARLGGPAALAPVPDGAHWLVADGGSGRVRRVDLTRSWVDTVAGYPSGRSEAADPRARYRALLASAAGVAYDSAAGVAYVAVSGSDTIAQLTLVDPADAKTWTLTTLAGVAGTPGYLDDPSQPSASLFDTPRGLAVDTALGVLYVADAGNHVLRAINLSLGSTTTVAGEAHVSAFFGEDVDASLALLSSPSALAVATDGSLYVADTGNHRVRRIDASTHRITTVVGDGDQASSGQGAPASTFSVDSPRGLALDAGGNLFVTSRVAVRLIVAGDDHVADGNDAVFTIYGQAPRASFPSVVTRCLSDVKLLPGDAEALLTDACVGMVVRLQRQRLAP